MASETKAVVPTKKKGPGRPKGRKNNLTLLKDAEMKHALKYASSHMVEHLPKLVEKLVNMANEGDMSAMKMILDRVIPTRKAVEHVASTERPAISINISTGAEPIGPFLDIVDAEVVDEK